MTSLGSLLQRSATLNVKKFAESQSMLSWKGPPSLMESSPIPAQHHSQEFPRVTLCAYKCCPIASWYQAGTVTTSLRRLLQCPLCCNLLSLFLILSLLATEKSLTPSSLHLLLRYLYALMRSPLSSLGSTDQLPESLLIAEMLQTPHHLHEVVLLGYRQVEGSC